MSNDPIARLPAVIHGRARLERKLGGADMVDPHPVGIGGDLTKQGRHP